jgi:hypothetical protein
MSLSYNQFFDPALSDLMPQTVQVIPFLSTDKYGASVYDTSNARVHQCLHVKSSDLTLSNEQGIERPADELYVNPVPVSPPGILVPVWIQWQDRLVLDDGRSPQIRDVEQFNLYVGSNVQIVTFQ